MKKSPEICWNTLHGRNPIYIYTYTILLEIYKRTVGRFSSEIKIAELLHYGNPSSQTFEDDDPSNSAIRTKPTPLKHIEFDAQKKSRYSCSCIVITVYLHQPGTTAVWSLSTRFFPQTLSKRTEEKHVRWDGFFWWYHNERLAYKIDK